jgi:MFS transporter, MHS family, shikimate and dehydroshikimate transport protein
MQDLPQTEIVKVAFASAVGTTVEWYDFFIYGTAAALVFNRQFFPEIDPLMGTLAAFATFGVGFFARPVGGVIFGHYGDRIGRKSMLVLSLLIMGVATFLIGFLPGYDRIGIWAPVLLVLLRLLQGFGVGGEWGGAVLMAVEHSPPAQRGFFGSWPQIGVPAGLLLATAVFTLFSALPDEAFRAWGWRVPFLLSIVLVVVGLFIRLRIVESPAFLALQRHGGQAQMPIVEVVREQPRPVLIAMGLRVAENGAFYVFSVFVLTYITEQLELPRSVALTGVLIAAAVELFTIPAFAALSDRVGRRPVYLAGALLSLAFAFPFFWLMDTRSPILIVLAIVVSLAVGHAAMYGPQAAFFSELFSTRVRYSGASLGYQLASVFAGGLSPFIATALLAWQHGDPWAVATYMAVMAFVTVIAVLVSKETHQVEIFDL